MNGVTAVISAMRTLDAKALSELALALCGRSDHRLDRASGSTGRCSAGRASPSSSRASSGSSSRTRSAGRRSRSRDVTLPSLAAVGQPLAVPVPQPDAQAEAKPKKKPTHNAAAAVGRRLGSGGTVTQPQPAPTAPAAAALVLAFPRQALRAAAPAAILTGASMARAREGARAAKGSGL